MHESPPQGARRLAQETLASFAPHIPIPTYDRARLAPAMVHVGVGGFHRAHQAVYLDTLAQRGITHDWGVCGVGLLPQDAAMHSALSAQDGLYTLVVRSAEAEQPRIIGSLTSYLFAPADPRRVIATLAAPTTRIISLTITEGGYNFNQATGEFDPTTPDIQHDLASPQQPRTVFGYLAAALDARRRAGLSPITVLSCDNVQGNGNMARKMLLAFCALRNDAALTAWVEEQVTFPNSMVDRITPQTTDANRQMVAAQFGVADAWPVMTEPFTQWVIEDAFCAGRPPLEEVGAQFTTDVHPYETMKIRLLNASHSAMAFLGYVAGYRFVHETMADRAFVAFIRRMMDVDVTPLVPPVPGIALPAYKNTLIERFSNPKIADQLARVCFDGSNRVPKFVVPSLHEALAQGSPHRYLTLALAGWLRYLGGTDEQGHPIDIQDPRGARLHALAVAGGADPGPLLSERSLFGTLGDHPAFVALLGEMLADIYAHGAQSALRRYVLDDAS